MHQNIGLTAQIFNVTLTDANTQYALPIPENTKQLEFEARTSAAIRWSLESGKVATPTEPYKTLKADRDYWEDQINLQGKTLYLASASAGTVVEVIFWI